MVVPGLTSRELRGLLQAAGVHRFGFGSILTSLHESMGCRAAIGYQ